MAKTTRAGVNTSIETNCATNGTGAITALVLQNPLKDLKDSALILNSDLPNVVFVNVVGDFGTPAGNVYTLLANTTYIINGAVAMGNARLTGSGNVTIQGFGLSLSSLVGTPVGGPMITHIGGGSLYVKDLSIDPGASGQAVALSGTPPSDNATFDSVRIVQQGVASTITSRGVVFFDRCSFAGGPALNLVGGTITSVVMESCGITVTGTSQTGILVQSGVTIQSRIRVQACSFNVAATCIGIDVNVGATIPVEGLYYTLTVFSGAGTATAGVGPQDNKSSAALNRGLEDSVSRGFMYMTEDNTTPTPIISSGTYAKVQGTTLVPSPDPNSRFTHSTGRLTYTGADPAIFLVRVNATLDASSTQKLRMRLYVNGSAVPGSIMETTTGATSNRASNAESVVLVTLNPNDYVEPYVTNMSGTTSIVVSFLQMIIT